MFTLGEGNYTEKDVTEAARALTGWSYDRLHQEFVARPNWHDSGQKTILGRTGTFDGKDFLELIAVQPQSARFITAKLWTFFAGEPPSQALREALARSFQDSGRQFKPLLRQMFSCEEFYAPSVIRNQVKSPVQWLVASVRMLESELPPPLACTALLRNLGQELFAPPNVKGWDGGLNWITTNTLLTRYNEAATLVQGDLSLFRPTSVDGRALMRKTSDRFQNARLAPVDLARLFTDAERADKDLLLHALEKRLLQSRLKPKQEQTLRQFLDSAGELDSEAILDAIRLVMSTPEYQLT